jgi:5'-nucleotidase
MPLPITSRIGRRVRVFAALLATVVLLVPATTLGAAQPTPVTFQILNVSDWHGNVLPVGGVGGAAAIKAYWDADRAAHPTLTLTAGDDVGASPPLSAFFEDAPAIKAQRMMGIQVGTLGNHNFDYGLARLQAHVDLAGAPTSMDAPGSPYVYVSANLKNRDQNVTGVKDFEIFDIGGIKVGVVGITNPEAPGLVDPGAFGTIEVTNPYSAANKARAAAKRAGAQVVIAITHMGVTGFVDGQPVGPLVDFANNVGGFAAIFGDHTDVQYSGVINNQLVLENRSFGVTYAKTLFTVNPRTGKVLERSAQFVTPTASLVTPDPAILGMLAPYQTALSAQLDGVIGTGTALYARGGNIERRQEVPLGNLIADGMRWKYGTQLGFMNGGGIRQTLPAGNYSPADTSLRRLASPYVVGPPYDIVLGDVYAILPFANVVVTRTVTGSQLWAALENGVSQLSSCNGTGGDGRFPQISGFKFTLNFNNPAGSRVTSVQLEDGTPIPADSTTYTMALPNFLNSGGDSYSMFADGQGVTRDLDANVMKDYMESFDPSVFDPSVYPLNRIVKTGDVTC